MVSQYSSSTKEQKLANLCELHWSQKSCPKDSFLLPKIDQLVDTIAVYEVLSFMNAYSRYNKIPMHLLDQKKTSFITEQGLYCYRVMPFDLKNAGATYQQLVNTIFKDHKSESMEVYVDDMFVKIQKNGQSFHSPS